MIDFIVKINSGFISKQSDDKVIASYSIPIQDVYKFTTIEKQRTISLEKVQSEGEVENKSIESGNHFSLRLLIENHTKLKTIKSFRLINKYEGEFI